MTKKSGWKKSAWRILFLCVFALGVWGVAFSYTQQPVTATVISTGGVTARKHRPRYGSAYTTYHMVVGVRFEENGEIREAEVAVAYRNRWFPPRIGRQFEITRNILGGMTVYPDMTLRTVGWMMIVAGAMLLTGAWLAARGEALNELETIRTGGEEQEPKTERKTEQEKE